MNISKSKLTVFFEGRFWVGVYEIKNENEYMICKIVFGKEPKDCEIYEFLITNYTKLKFSNSLISKDKDSKNISPKRLQRIIHKQVNERYWGTKSQQLLKEQQKQLKNERNKNKSIK